MDWDNEDNDVTAERLRDYRSVPTVPTRTDIKAKRRVACSAFLASEQLARRLQAEEEQRRAQIVGDFGIARALAGNHEQNLGNPRVRRDPPRQPPIARNSASTGQRVPSTTDHGDWSVYGYITSALSWLLGSPIDSQ